MRDIKLDINITSGSNDSDDIIDVNKVFDNLVLNDTKETVVIFTVPDNVQKLNLKLTASVDYAHSQKDTNHKKAFIVKKKLFFWKF